jgi:hypothetical protein
MTLPELHPQHQGTRHEATCGRCFKFGVAAGDPSGAWAKLVVQGWTLCMSTPNARSYAVCPACGDMSRARHRPRGRR